MSIIDRDDLRRAQWDGLCRLARALGLRPEGQHRGSLVKVILYVLKRGASQRRATDYPSTGRNA